MVSSHGHLRALSRPARPGCQQPATAATGSPASATPGSVSPPPAASSRLDQLRRGQPHLLPAGRSCAVSPAGPGQWVVRAKTWIAPGLVLAGRVTLATPSAGLMGTAAEYTLVVPYTVDPQPQLRYGMLTAAMLPA